MPLFDKVRHHGMGARAVIDRDRRNTMLNGRGIDRDDRHSRLTDLCKEFTGKIEVDQNHRVRPPLPEESTHQLLFIGHAMRECSGHVGALLSVAAILAVLVHGVSSLPSDARISGAFMKVFQQKPVR